MADPLGGGGSTATKFETPEIIWNAQGEAGYWRAPFYEGGQAVFVRQPQFDDPRKAVDYQAPRAAPAPRYPTTEVTPTGDIYQIDPYTGIPRYVGNDPRLATGFSPSQQRANDVFDRKQDERFQLDVLGRQQVYGTSERLGSEAFTSSENALDRAIQAANYAASVNFQNQQNAFTADQAYQSAMRQYSQDRLSSAQQVANNISAVDPAALQAFYEAGGGVIANNLAHGMTGRSNLSDYASAAALRAGEEMKLPERFTFTPVEFDPSAWMPKQAPVVPQPTFSAPQTFPVGQKSPLGVPSGQAAAQGAAKSRAEAAQGIATAFDAAGETWRMENGQWVKMAEGGATDNRLIVTGDHPSGRQNEEAVINPTGAPLIVIPLSKMGQAGREISQGAPKAATGGLFLGTDPIHITDEDRPYLDRIGEVRDNVEFPNLNPFDVRFALNAPSQIQRYYAGKQTKYAIPAEDLAAEANRFTLSGIGRGGLALGI